MIQAVGANAHEKNLKNLLTKLRTYDIIKLQKDSRSPKNGERVDTMTNTNKITQKSAVEYVLANCEIPADVREKFESMLVSLEKKSGAIRKPTANQRENAELRGVIFELMEVGKQYRASELTKMLNAQRGSEFSAQRVSAILRQMKLDGEIAKIEEKRVSYFVRNA